MNSSGAQSHPDLDHGLLRRTRLHAVDACTTQAIAAS